MQTKRKAKKPWIIFDSKESAQLFLDSQWELFKKLKTVSERLLFLKELQASPEWRTMISIFDKKRLAIKDTRGECHSLMSFERAESPNHFSQFTQFDNGYLCDRTFLLDLEQMRQFYNMNHLPGQP